MATILGSLSLYTVDSENSFKLTWLYLSLLFKKIRKGIAKITCTKCLHFFNKMNPVNSGLSQ